MSEESNTTAPDQNNGENQTPKDMLISYYTLRKLLGTLGIVLPIVLAVSSWVLAGRIIWPESSISIYYYSPMRDLFVGINCAMAIFLFTYKGYPKKRGGKALLSENAITNIAGFMVLLVAMLPTNSHNCLNGVQIPITSKTLNSVLTVVELPSAMNVFGSNLHCCDPVLGGIHLASAGLFFALVGYLSIFRFTIAGDDSKTEKFIYRFCGWAIAGSLLIMILYVFVGPISNYFNTAFPGFPLLFIFETTSLWAFGIAWLVKGKAQEDVRAIRKTITRKFRRSSFD